jgi:hypothetical protein
VLHLVQREGVTVVNVGEKLFVCPLVAGGFREVETHESDEGILDCHGLHVAELRSRSIVIDAPVTGYKRKISVHSDVPLSGESTLIFANTLWRGAKAWVCFLRNHQSQCRSTVCEALL